MTTSLRNSLNTPLLLAARCSLAKDSGPCKANMARFYYNSTMGMCQEFVYGGCQGNRNRFMTYESCMGQCGDVTELRSAPIITTTEQSPQQPDIGEPTGRRQHWAFYANEIFGFGGMPLVERIIFKFVALCCLFVTPSALLLYCGFIYIRVVRLHALCKRVDMNLTL